MGGANRSARGRPVGFTRNNTLPYVSRHSLKFHVQQRVAIQVTPRTSVSRATSVRVLRLGRKRARATPGELGVASGVRSSLAPNSCSPAAHHAHPQVTGYARARASAAPAHGCAVAAGASGRPTDCRPTAGLQGGISFARRADSAASRPSCKRNARRSASWAVRLARLASPEDHVRSVRVPRSGITLALPVASRRLALSQGVSRTAAPSARGALKPSASRLRARCCCADCWRTWPRARRSSDRPPRLRPPAVGSAT